MQKSKVKMQNYGIKHYFRESKSQAMLVAILIISAAALAISIAVATMGSSEVNIGLVSRDSGKSYALAETCLENTLMRLSRGQSSVPPTFTLTDGNCTIEITGTSPYQITSTAQVGKTRRKIRSTVTVANEILNIQSWQEVYN